MDRVPMFVAAIVTVLTTTGCGSTSSSTVAGPTPVRCQLAATNNTPTFNASGGSGAVVVNAARECAWTGAAQATWIALEQPTGGQGDGTLSYRVHANPAGIPRRGSIDVGGVMVEVGQEAAPCRFELSTRSLDVPASGGAFEITLQVPAGCSWNASSQVPWAGVSGTQGTGPGRVTVSVAANPGPVRQGTVTIAGLSVDVTQRDVATSPTDPTQPPTPLPPPAPDCRYEWAPGSADFPAAGGDGVVALHTRADCTWDIQVDVAWIALRSPASGRGVGEAVIEFRVAPSSERNTRQGRLRVGTTAFTVRQAGSGDGPPPAECTFAVEPTQVTVGADGWEGTVTVNTAAPCSWNASSNAPWIIVTSGAGTGPGEVRYRVEANPSTSPRAGTLTVAGQTVTVEQAGVASQTVTLSGAIQGLSGSCPDVTFRVGGRDVRTSAATTFRRGSCNRLTDGTAVIVRGEGVPGSLVEASEVEYARDDLSGDDGAVGDDDDE
jgi:hypothetical protein